MSCFLADRGNAGIALVTSETERVDFHEADRGAIPEYDDKWNNAGWEGWLTYYPADDPQRLDKPLAVVHSEAAAIPDGTHRFLEGLGGQASEEWLEDVSQFDFYDVPENITRATKTIAAHFADTADADV